LLEKLATDFSIGLRGVVYSCLGFVNGPKNHQKGKCEGENLSFKGGKGEKKKGGVGKGAVNWCQLKEASPRLG